MKNEITLNELKSITSGYDQFYYDETKITEHRLNEILELIKDDEEVNVRYNEDGSFYAITNSTHGDYYNFNIIIKNEGYKVQPIEVDEMNNVLIGYIITNSKTSMLEYLTNVDAVDEFEEEHSKELIEMIRKLEE